jgi:rubrerythrin
MKREFASLAPYEALHVGIFIEERNARIYENFAQIFEDFRDQESARIAAAFREMAAEERHHGSVLQQRYVERFGTRPCSLTDADIADLVEVPELTDGEMFILGRIPPEQALTVGLAAERQARRFYLRLSELTRDPLLRSLYQEFAEFERGHEEFIEQKLAERKPAREGG